MLTADEDWKHLSIAEQQFRREVYRRMNHGRGISDEDRAAICRVMFDGKRSRDYTKPAR